MTTMHTGAVLRQIDRLFGTGTVAGLSDAQLLGRFRTQRDEAAFVALVARHGPMVLAACRGVLRDEHAAEDAFQATFLILIRKASVLWVGESLGGWLHRVAYRVAMQARADVVRRAARENEARETAALTATPLDLDDEFRALLHAEIGRLPDRLRLPVVLCDLEGLTRDQAAERLCWTEGTLRGRLARARARLRERLTQRGVVVPAGVLAVALARETSAAVVSEVLLSATVRAAAGRGTASTVAALTAHVIRTMLATKLKAAAVVAVSIAALAAIGGIVASGGSEGEKPPSPVAAAPPVVLLAAPPEDEPGVMVAVPGRVVGPDGQAVAGATLRTAFLDTDDHRTPEATSGPDGRFLMRIPRSIRNDAMLNDTGGDTFPWVVGSAPGFGPGMASGAFKATRSGLTVRLVEDGPPIEGRIIDLEGRPVAGAQVKVERVWFAVDTRPPHAETGDLSAWIETVRDRGVRGPSDGLSSLPASIVTTTGPDGRFRLAGSGRERVAEMLISGPTIATTVVYAMTRNGPEARCVDRRLGESRSFVFHAPRFEHAVAPAKPVEGVIRDKDTGRPIAGLTLHAAVGDGGSLIATPGIEATTDAQGHYRLSGIPKAPVHRLFVEPGEGLPYPRAAFRVPADSPALEAVHFDMTLKRGILLRGRVTDKATGKPVPGFVNAFTFRDNPFIKEFPGYVWNDLPSIYLKEDGRYEVVALPGRNIITCRSKLGRYRGSVGAETIKGYDPGLMSFATTLPLSCHVRNYHVLAEVDIDPMAESATLDLQVDPGRTLSLTVVDPEGNPIGGTRASGIGDLFSSTEYPQESPTIEIHALDPSKPRRVTITHAARKLIGSTYLRGDETGPLTLGLQSWGTITGRIVDDEGKPRGGLALSSIGGSFPKRPDVQGILPGGDVSGGIRLGSDGRFRVDGLVPSLMYGAWAESGLRVMGRLFQDVTVAPGEVKDLGDLRVVLRKENPL